MIPDSVNVRVCQRNPCKDYPTFLLERLPKWIGSRSHLPIYEQFVTALQCVPLKAPLTSHTNHAGQSEKPGGLTDSS